MIFSNAGNSGEIVDVVDYPTDVFQRVLDVHVMGAFLAIALAITLEYLNPRITSAEDVGNSLGLPLLGVAPRIAAMKKGRPRMDSLPPPFEEAIRSIRTRILLSVAHGNLRTLAVTSTSTPP